LGKRRESHQCERWPFSTISTFYPRGKLADHPRPHEVVGARHLEGDRHLRRIEKALLRHHVFEGHQLTFIDEQHQLAGVQRPVPLLEVTESATIAPTGGETLRWLRSRDRRKLGIKYGTTSPDRRLPRHVAQLNLLPIAGQDVVIRRCKRKTTDPTDHIHL
jgi:hypothetical protein